MWAIRSIDKISIGSSVKYFIKWCTSRLLYLPDCPGLTGAALLHSQSVAEEMDDCTGRHIFQEGVFGVLHNVVEFMQFWRKVDSS